MHVPVSKKMRLHLLSDLHLEFGAYEPDAATAASSDVIVLAGDIDVGVAGIEWARRTFENKEVVYVCGNHELYGGHWDATLADMRRAADLAGVHFLENGILTLGAVRFLGTALWTDFRYFGRTNEASSMAAFEQGLNDCRMIAADPVQGSSNQRDRLTASHVQRRHLDSVAWLEEQLHQQFAGTTVVVTHHLPHVRSVAPRYLTDSLTPGFASNLPEELVTQTDFWLHGHTHDSFDYVLHGPSQREPRAVCNPRGYPLRRQNPPYENREFNPALVLEV
jgi:predicted phosphodiesterase